MGKLHTTNYFNTFIEIAEDCKLIEAKIPEPLNGRETIALLQYKIIDAEPYRYTSDDVLFMLHAQKNSLPLNESERELFFSKGRACFRPF